MRIKITFYCDEVQSINLNYNYYLTSLIYKLLSKSDAEYTTFLHDEGYVLNNKGYKMFTYSMLMPKKYFIEKGFLNIQGIMNWFVSSPSKDFIFNLIDSLSKVERVKIGDGYFSIIGLEWVKDTVFTEHMKFRCLSPISTATAYLCEDRSLKKRDLYIEDKRFTDNLRLNLLSKYEVIYGEAPLDTRLQIRFIDIEGYKRGKLINYKNGVKVKGYLAPLEIYGNPALIQIAYECGFGDRNSLGLGMVEVI